MGGIVSGSSKSASKVQERIGAVYRLPSCAHAPDACLGRDRLTTDPRKVRFEPSGSSILPHPGAGDQPEVGSIPAAQSARWFRKSSTASRTARRESAGYLA